MNLLISIIKRLRNKIIGRIDIEWLIKNGLIIGKNVSIQNEVIIDPSHCWLISIGDNCTIAPRVYILAHDASTKYTKIGRVSIGNNCFIGAGSIILPNVKIGQNVIIGAGCVVTHDIPDNSVAVGNPARVVESTLDYLKNHQDKMKLRLLYNDDYTLKGNITDSKKEQMKKQLSIDIGYVE